MPVLNGDTITEAFGTIASMGTATLTIVTQAPPVAATLNSRATVSSSTPDPNANNNTALNIVTVTPVSDIQVSLTGPPSVLVDQPLVYILTATNQGPSVADGVVVTDTLPLSTLATFVSATADSGPSPTVSGVTVTDNYGTLNPNQSVTIVITVLPSITAPPSVKDTANATSNELDPVPSNNTASLTTPVLPSVDVAITSESANPGSVTATHNVTFTVGFANDGPSPATGVIVVDTLPVGFTFVSGSTTIGTFKVSGRTITVNAPNMAANATGTLTIVANPSLVAVGNDTNSATISADQSDPDTSNNTEFTGVTVVPLTSDLAITSATAAPARVLVGSDATFVVNVVNSGPDPATSTFLTDAVPNGMVILNVIASAGVATISGNTISVSLGTLASGATATLTVVAQATATSVGTVTNTASIAATDVDPNLSNNTAFASTVVSVPLTDLAVTSVTATPGAVLLGQNVTLTINVVNNGPDQATAATIVDSLPAGLTLVSASLGNNNGGVQSQNNAAVATLPTLNSGGTATLTIVAKATALGSISDAASITGAQVDPTPTNNSAGTSITVNPAADLQVKIVPTPVPALVGQNLTYNVTVTNAGPSTATDVLLADTLPSTATFVSATLLGSTTTQVGGIVTVPVGTLAPGASATLTIVVMPSNAAVGLITDTANATADQANPNPNDAYAKSITTVAAVANLGVTVTDSSAQVTEGNTLTYTVTVSNPGPNDATNVLLFDTLPTGTTFGSATPSSGTAAFSQGTVTALLGTIPVGQSAALTISVTPNTPSTITDTASVEADQVDATGTSAASVNTVVVTPPGTFSFQLPAYAAAETAGTIPVTILRTGGFQGVVTVHVASAPGGNATPGVDYVPLSQTLVFGQGVTAQTVNLSVLPDPNDRTNETLNLQLTSATNGAGIGAGSTANVTIIDTDPNIVGPTVTSLRLIGPATSVIALDFGFSKPLNPATATNVNNYHILAPGNVFVPIKAAVYDPTTLSVLVYPSVPLKANVTYQAIASGTQPGAIMDLAGNPLNSVFNAVPAANFISPVARGTKITYAEGTQVITLQIQGGGILDVSDFALNQAPTVQVLGGIPHRTVITGSVKPGGITRFHQILGLGKFGAISAKLLVGPFFSDVFAFTSTKSVDAPAVDVLLPSAAVSKPAVKKR